MGLSKPGPLAPSLGVLQIYYRWDVSKTLRLWVGSKVRELCFNQTFPSYLHKGRPAESTGACLEHKHPKYTRNL